MSDGRTDATLARYGARLDGHDQAIEDLKANDTRIERTLSGWLAALDRKMWAIVLGVGLSVLGVLGSLFVSVLTYSNMGKHP